MDLRTKILVTYQGQLDTNPHLNMQGLAEKLAPDNAKQIASAFQHRVESREKDLQLFDDLDERDEASARKLLKEITERERSRSVTLSQQLERIVNAERLAKLSRQVVKERGLAALAHPLISKDLGLTADQVEAASAGTAKIMHEAMAMRNAKFNGIDREDGRGRALAETFNILTLKQLTKYFTYTGQLTDGEDIENIVSKFPQDARDALSEVIESKIAIER